MHSPHKLYGERVRRFSQRIETVLYDAYRRMDAHREERELDPPRPGEVQVYSWPQQWPDWSCGFGGDARQEPCVDQTHVITDDGLGAAYVYHAGRFARRVEKPGKAFWVRTRQHDLPGASDEAGWEALEKPD